MSPGVRPLWSEGILWYGLRLCLHWRGSMQWYRNVECSFHKAGPSSTNFLCLTSVLGLVSLTVSVPNQVWEYQNVVNELCNLVFPDQVQWDFMHGLMENAIYGGRVDNTFDMRVLTSYLLQYFSNSVVAGQVLYLLYVSGTYTSMHTG